MLLNSERHKSITFNDFSLVFMKLNIMSTTKQQSEVRSKNGNGREYRHISISSKKTPILDSSELM